jgi:hypothetical protein
LPGGRRDVPILFMDRDPRTLRLHDIQPQDVLTAQCPCGHIGRFAEGDLQRRFRVPSDTLIGDLQYRMRCRHCRRDKGIRIILWKGEPMMSRSSHDIGHHEVIVEGDVNDRVRI